MPNERLSDAENPRYAAFEFRGRAQRARDRANAVSQQRFVGSYLQRAPKAGLRWRLPRRRGVEAPSVFRRRLPGRRRHVRCALTNHLNAALANIKGADWLRASTEMCNLYSLTKCPRATATSPGDARRRWQPAMGDSLCHDTACDLGLGRDNVRSRSQPGDP
jgi:hypothetical protein